MRAAAVHSLWRIADLALQQDAVVLFVPPLDRNQTVGLMAAATYLLLSKGALEIAKN